MSASSARQQRQIESIIVVGGGDAGLLTALALEKGLAHGEITIIDDFTEPVPEVGKSTLGNVAAFLHQSLEIPPHRLWSEVGLSFKTTVFFEDWCGVESFHSPLSFPVLHKAEADQGGMTNLTADHEDEFHEYYYRYTECDFTDIYGEVAETPGKTPLTIRNKDGPRVVPHQQLTGFSYHFDSGSFNSFLRELCRERGIELIDDRVNEVNIADDQIESISGEDSEYTADLYLDSSGFKRLLVNELDRTFLEFDSPVDRALVTKTTIPIEEVTSATVVTSGEAGWFWQIDTVDGANCLRDLGYVYSSDHLTEEEAKTEFVDSRAEDISASDMRCYPFSSGVFAEPWQGNCVAVGNAMGFVEPLQSTALSTHCKLAGALTRGLAKHARINCEGLRRMYNESARATWDEVFDFVSLYYKFSSGSGAFWEEARSINPGEIENVSTYRESGFSAWQELTTLTRTGTDLNGIHLYYLVIRSLGVDSPFYEQLDVDVDDRIAEGVEQFTEKQEREVEQLATYEELANTFPGMFTPPTEDQSVH